MKDSNNETIANRFVTVMGQFEDCPELRDELALAYMVHITDLMWHPGGEDEHIVVFDDESGVCVYSDGSMKAGHFALLGEDGKKTSLAHRHLNAIDATKCGTQDRERAVSAMTDDISKVVGDLDNGAMYLMKDMSCLLVIRAHGEISMSAKSSMAVLRELTQAAVQSEE